MRHRPRLIQRHISEDMCSNMYWAYMLKTWYLQTCCPNTMQRSPVQAPNWLVTVVTNSKFDSTTFKGMYIHVHWNICSETWSVKMTQKITLWMFRHLGMGKTERAQWWQWQDSNISKSSSSSKYLWYEHFAARTITLVGTYLVGLMHKSAMVVDHLQRELQASLPSWQALASWQVYF